MSTPEKRMEIRELIGEVSDQLRQAVVDLDSKDATLQLDNVEIEVSVGASSEGSAGIRLWVVELGGDIAAEHTHRVKATFGKYPGFSGAFYSGTEPERGDARRERAPREG